MWVTGICNTPVSRILGVATPQYPGYCQIMAPWFPGYQGFVTPLVSQIPESCNSRSPGHQEVIFLLFRLFSKLQAIATD